MQASVEQKFQPAKLILELESIEEINVMYALFNTPRISKILDRYEIKHGNIRRALDQLIGFDKNKAFMIFEEFRDG